MKYRVILADPPWRYDQFRETKNGAAVAHYNCMSLDDLCALPVSELADPNSSYLFLWATGVAIAEGWATRVIGEWGFSPVTTAFVWVKTNADGSPYCGLGRYTRSASEFVILGRRGKYWRESSNVRQVVEAPVGRHSEKPREVHDRIVELCGDVKRIELFARDRVDGWDVMGDEAPGWRVEFAGARGEV